MKKILSLLIILLVLVPSAEALRRKLRPKPPIPWCRVMTTSISVSSTYSIRDYGFGTEQTNNVLQCGPTVRDGDDPDSGSFSIGYAVFDTSVLEGEVITKVELLRHFINGTQNDLGFKPPARVLSVWIEDAEVFRESGTSFAQDQWIDLGSHAGALLNLTGDTTISFHDRDIGGSATQWPYTEFSGPILRVTHGAPAAAVGASAFQLMVGK